MFHQLTDNNINDTASIQAVGQVTMPPLNYALQLIARRGDIGQIVCIVFKSSGNKYVDSLNFLLSALLDQQRKDRRFSADSAICKKVGAH